MGLHLSGGRAETWAHTVHHQTQVGAGLRHSTTPVRVSGSRGELSDSRGVPKSRDANERLGSPSRSTLARDEGQRNRQLQKILDGYRFCADLTHSRRFPRLLPSPVDLETTSIVEIVLIAAV